MTLIIVVLSDDSLANYVSLTFESGLVLSTQSANGGVLMFVIVVSLSSKADLSNLLRKICFKKLNLKYPIHPFFFARNMSFH